MKPIYSLFLILLLALGFTIVVLVTPEPANGHGIAHLQFTGMKQVGDALGAARPVLIPGLALGVLMYLLVATLIYLSVPERKRSRPFLLSVLAALLVALLAWISLTTAYQDYLSENELTLILGFPVPTILMLLAVWLAPLCFALIFVAGFRHWIYTEEDEARFNSLMEKAKKQ